MTRSDDLKDFAVALAKAQAEIAGAKKDSENPHFRSKYADLASVWDACRTQLTKYGLSVVQSPRLVGGGDTAVLAEVETLILHTSGQWIADTLAVPVTKVDAQGVGSAVTYARRYALAALVGVAPEDDDGEGAVSRNGATTDARPLPKRTAPAGFDDWLTDLRAVADEGTFALQAAWTKSKAEYREYLTNTARTTWEQIKTKAAKVVREPSHV